jgi:UDP:flavonoid glycosyltransferase YjiC (YdhE family)
MRLLFTTTGQAGHVLPLVPLARACLRAGHEVRVAGPR